MPVDAGGGDTGVHVPGAYMTLLTDQCRTMYVLDPRFWDPEDPESMALFDAKQAELAARAEALIAQRAARGDPVYVRRRAVGSNVLPVPAGVPMFARTVDNLEFMRRGSFRVTPDDVITASDLWPPQTSVLLDPLDPLPDGWPCEPREPSAGSRPSGRHAAGEANGAQVRVAGRDGKSYPRLRDPDILRAKVRELREAGMSMREIAAGLGCSVGTVHRYA